MSSRFRRPMHMATGPTCPTPIAMFMQRGIDGWLGVGEGPRRKLAGIAPASFAGRAPKHGTSRQQLGGPEVGVVRLASVFPGVSRVGPGILEVGGGPSSQG